MPLSPLQLQENVNAMIDQGANDSDIDGYLSTQGTSMAALQQPEPSQSNMPASFSEATDISKLPQNALAVTGSVGRGVEDLVNKGASGLWNAAKYTSPITTSEIQDLGKYIVNPEGALSIGTKTIAQNDINALNQSFPETMKSIQNFPQEHPVTYQTGKDLLDTAAILPLLKPAMAGVGIAKDAIGTSAGALGKVVGLGKKSADSISLEEGLNLYDKYMNNINQTDYANTHTSASLLHPETALTFTNKLESGIKSEGAGISPTLHPKTLEVVNNLQDLADKGQLTLGDILNANGELNLATIPQDENLASKAKTIINDMLPKLSAEKDFTGGNPQMGLPAVLNATKGYAAGMRFKKILDIAEKANGNNTKIQNGIRNLLANEYLSSGYTPIQIANLQNISKSTKASELLGKTIGRLGIDLTHGGTAGLIPAGEILASVAGHGGAALPALALGTVVRTGESMATKNALNKAISSVSKIKRTPYLEPKTPLSESSNMRFVRREKGKNIYVKKENN